MIWLVVYIMVGLLSWPVIAGMQFAWMGKSVIESYRERLGDAIAWGFFYAVMWPLGMPAMLLLTGFMEKGWRLTDPKEQGS